MRKQENNQTPDNEQIARRRLLKAAIYTPPAILGAMTIGVSTAHAVPVTYNGITFDVSGTSNACNPCQDILDGNYSNRDIRRCVERQCRNLCINCDSYIAIGATRGDLCDNCEDALDAGCYTSPPAACDSCGCRQRRRRGNWRC